MKFNEHRKNLVDTAYSKLISSFKETGNYNNEFLRSSLLETENYLVREIFQEKWKGEIIPESLKHNFSLDHLKLELYSWRRDNPLVLPLPEFRAELSGVKLGIAAVLGGMFAIILFFIACLLISMFSLTFLSDNLYLLVYSIVVPLGCGCSVWFVWSCSNSKIMRRLVMSFLGLSAFFEVVCLVNSAKSLFSIFRSRNRGFLFFLRLPLYLIVAFILKNTVKKPNLNSVEYRELVTAVLNIWIIMIVQAARLIVLSENSDNKEYELNKINADKLLEYIYKLYYSETENLPVVASEIISYLKTQGFEGVDKIPSFISNNSPEQQSFIWEAGLDTKYEALGVVEAGDKVLVESVPIIKDGEIITKGIVRKIRT